MPNIIKSCDKCAKVRVCGIFRAIAPLMKSFEDHQPFQAEDLATICNEFLSAKAVSYLAETETVKH
jgi:hypothetical protein